MASAVTIKRVLLAVDGSPGSKKAAKYAIHLAALEKAELTILHTVEDIKSGGVIGLQERYGNISLVQAFYNSRKASAQEFIKPLEEAAKKEGIKVKSEVLLEPGQTEVEGIVQYAEKNASDLIIMGTRGRSKFKRLLLGSISDGVVSYAPCPVLIVR